MKKIMDTVRNTISIISSRTLCTRLEQRLEIRRWGVCIEVDIETNVR